MADMFLIHDILATTVAKRRRRRHISVSMLPGRHVLLSTKRGAVTISAAELRANWPDKGKLISLLEAKMEEAEALVRSRKKAA